MAESRITRMFDAIRSYWSGPLTSRSPELARLYGAPPASSGIPVDETTALNYSAVWAAVGVISGDISALPLMFYRKAKGGGKEVFDGHGLYRLLHDAPNPQTTSIIFRRVLMGHVLLWGNGYAEIERDGQGRPVALWQITPDRVQVEGSRYRVSNPSRPDTILAAEDMFHIRGLSWDGMTGYSVISKARESVGLGMAAEKFGATFFGNGSTFGGVISHPNALSETAKRNLENSIESRHKGVDRAHRFIVLEEGMSYSRLGIQPNDAQFLETRQFQVPEIARWFGIPPHKIGDLSRATFSNIEQQTIDYYTTTLLPWLKVWEQEISLKLIAASERNIQFAEHSVEGLLRGDAQARADYYSKMFQIGAFTPNEIRELENFNPLPGGDVAYVPQALVPVNRVNDLIDVKANPPTPPAPPQPVQGGNDNNRDEIKELTERLLVESAGRAAAERAITERNQAILEERTEFGQSIETIVHETTEKARMDVKVAEGLQADAQRALAAAVQAKADADQRAVDADERADEILGSLTTANRLAGKHESERDAAEKARAEATVNMAHAEMERDAAQAAIESNKLAEQDRIAGVLAGHRAILEDMMARIIRRETEKARSHQLTQEKLRTWMGNFYTLHADTCREMLQPIISLSLAWRQAEDDPRAVTEAFVQQHIDASIRDLQAALDVDPEDWPRVLERVLRRWETERAARLADDFLTKEIGHVRRAA
jgi:HK97 family phage portal protein